MSEHGPFNSEREALDTQAYAALRAIDDTDPDLRAFPAACLKLITDACEAAGAELGAYDLAWLRWLTGWEITHCLSLAGIIRRAFEAGQRAAQPPEGAVTEWGVRGLADKPVAYGSEKAARYVAAPGDFRVFRRQVTPWTEAPETKGDGDAA